MDLNTIILVLVIGYLIFKKTFEYRVMELKKLVVLPAVFLYLLYSMVHKSFVLDPYSYIAVGIGGVLGIGVGFLVSLTTQVKADKEKLLIGIQGGWFNVIVVAFVIGIKFLGHYLIAVYPSIEQPSTEQSLFLLVLSFATTIIIGRSLAYYYKYTEAPSEELTVTASK